MTQPVKALQAPTQPEQSADATLVARIAERRAAAEVRKLRTEASKLAAEARKLRRDDHWTWRLVPSVVAVLSVGVAGLGVWVTLRKNAEDAALNALKRWRTLQGSFEIAPDAWRRDVAWEALPPCSGGISPDNACPSASPGIYPAPPEARLGSGAGLLCREGLGETKYRRFRCWQAFHEALHDPRGIKPTITATLTAVDFDLDAKLGCDSSLDPKACWVEARNPRLQVYIPTDAVSERGFEVTVQTWSNTHPWMAGIAWTATGLVAQHGE